MRAPGRSSSRQPASGSGRSGRPAGAGRAGGARARPGGKPRTAASGAATGTSGAGRHPPGHLTSRAAILAVVVCAIVLSLAYPVREYIAQRRQIAELRAAERVQEQRIAALEARKQKLSDPNYVKRQARRRLHYCMPGETCYVVVSPEGRGGDAGSPAERADHGRPWYVTLWKSVESADRGSGMR